ncbi:MAG: hypothetical protein CVU95_07715 [Firmicutes bacterium HGW-Firmicutes-2]|jgi:hypothetical protein|nr:MAG: hypothetical protein CVU95_07715 [Firmicutes bacterium HGW-Firmicutes-2]
MKDFLITITLKSFKEQSLGQKDINVYADSDNVYEALSKGYGELVNQLIDDTAEQLIFSDQPHKQEAKLTYHTLIQDKFVTKICIDREKIWDELINIFEQGERSWNLEEIEEAIKSLQEYFALDYPIELHIPTQKYRLIIDNILRVSLYYNSMVKNEKLIDNGDLSYITKKIMEILLTLGVSQ